MKYSQWIGIIVAFALIAATFNNWTWHPDLKNYFTGFYSEQNLYGKPGKLIVILSALAIIMFLIKKVWAKRVNWIFCAVLAAYALRTYLSFSACYRGICPEKQPALYVVLIAPAIMLLMAFLPELPRSSSGDTKTS